MEQPFQIFIATASSLLIGLSIEIFSLSRCTPANIPSVSFKQLSPQLSAEQLYQLAQSITVKVLSGQNWGSGIIINHQGQVYTVVTNEHVLIFGDGESYPIQTPDGQTHQADLVKTIHFGENDLGLLQFRSANAYTVASLGDSSQIAVGDEVFAAGFPFEADPSQSQGFVFTTGKISQLIDKVLVGGYQIGYTNDIEKGMSGGPLLNGQGKVIGINSMHKYPLWGNPYIFTDGSVASEVMQEQMSQLSWAVPVQTFLQLAPQFTADTVPTPPSPLILEQKPPEHLPKLP